MKLSTIAAVFLLGMLLATGCGPKIPKTAQIKIELVGESDEWRPSSVEIVKGGTVTWTNTGKVQPHSVISGEGLFSKTLGTGESFSFTFTQNGTFTFRDATGDFIGTIYVK